MNVNFKVLWFEDEMGWRPSSERSDIVNIG